MHIIFYIFIFLIFNINSYATNTSFSISVCTTSTRESANSCKNEISKSTKENIFIIKDEKDKKFRTYIGSFSTYSQAKTFINNSSSFIKKQKPFIKELTKTLYVEDIKNKPINLDKEDVNVMEEFYLKKFYVAHPIKQVKINNPIIRIKDFDTLVVEVDSKTNIMSLKGKNNQQSTNIKSYKVSTAKNNIKKPLGIGNITAISFEPTWYPTQKTVTAFKQKGINLPAIVPFGDKLNYMGAAKINLTHRVNGKEVYRIHGTLDESTIGTNESSGCIRMKNNEVIELASLLDEFANFRSFENIKIVLK